MSVCVLCGDNEAPAPDQACPFCACRRFLGWDEPIDQVEFAALRVRAEAADERLKKETER